MEMHRKTHKDLIVWQRAMSLAEAIYRVTRSFPVDERFGLIAQMRRAATSIPSNIAEGAARKSSAEYLNFLHIARGSLAEIETQFTLAQRLGMLSDGSDVRLQLERVGQLLNALVTSIAKNRRKRTCGESRLTNHESQ